MSPRPIVRRFALVAVLLAGGLAACGGSGGDEAAPTTASPTTAPPAEEASAPDAHSEADDAGAEEVLEAVTENLAATRELVDSMEGVSTAAEIQGIVREVRNGLFDTDGALRDIEVGDEALADAVDDFYASAGQVIGAYDAFTTADPSAMGQREAGDLNLALVAGMGASAALQEAASGLLADGAVPEGPPAVEVLAAPDELPASAGDPDAYVVKPEGTLPLVDEGPCGEASPASQIEPRSHAAAWLEDPLVSAIERVYVMADDDEALDYLEATEAYFGCDVPEGLDSVEIDEVDGGLAIELIEGGVGSVLLVVAEADHVLFVNVAAVPAMEVEDGLDASLDVATAIVDTLRENLAG